MRQKRKIFYNVYQTGVESTHLKVHIQIHNLLSHIMHVTRACSSTFDDLNLNHIMNKIKSYFCFLDVK